MKALLPILVLIVLSVSPAGADGEPAGVFDHYVMALSWSPSWCRAVGDARGAAQCGPEADRGFVLHGLWPQHARGWPEYCRTAARDPSRAETSAVAHLFGGAGAAWHQWKKHGRCSGLDPTVYFDLAREAYDSVARPDLLRRLEEAVRIDPDVVEEAFLEANPGLGVDGVAVTCRDGLIREVRICLDKELAPRGCGRDLLEDACRATEALLPPVR